MIKNLLLTAGFLYLSTTALADAGPKVPSKVQKVVLFLNGAQVTRTAQVSIAPGNSTLVFDGISPDIDVQSLQVKAGGDFTILSVKHELDFINKQSKQKRIQDLLDQQKAIRNKLQVQTNALSIYKEEENMLLKNQVINGANTNLDVAKLKQALDFQTARLTEVKKKEQLVSEQIELINADLEKYDLQIADINKPDNKSSGKILVAVSSKSALQSNFILSYVVKQAGWYPTYDIRAKNVNNPITIAYKANVNQQCGEEWNNVKLSLSTGNPSTSGSKPELNPYYLNFGMLYANQAASITRVSGRVTGQDDHQPLTGANVRVKGTSIGTTVDATGNYNLQVPQGSSTLEYYFVGYETQEIPVTSALINVALKPHANQLNEVVAVGYISALQGRVAGIAVNDKVRLRGISALQTNPVVVQQNENQTNVEFNIDNPYTIPGDGKPYLVEINQVSVPAAYEYYVAPKISTDVFLTAKLTDWNQYSFLPGEANLFFEGTFIGKSLIDTRATNDTLNLSLGVDKGIVVTRTLQQDLTSKQSLLGSTKKETRNWLITVKNRKTQHVNLLVQDLVPVSQNSAIEVETQELSGGKVDAVTGIISWNVNLHSQAEKKLRLKYQVRYPKNQSVIVQ
ncbi:mucoidy inhibitor MuiA family protein [Mucilaginibacter sp. Bleaf8]|uniref:DUF4139 domain-containing protein n=1 Tax=Mucilaginibacter sp. Bleaf8 TaxID=2834430 RepID=UPI001BCF2159|nr:mucoidy inhibitor MuiA family protein [Mucilaginibacter sp. Bleaf8]MBS7564582.1 mucoidy inhibitor MuiA family protein [Mucilaginibacter sp. Bleaf8]